MNIACPYCKQLFPATEHVNFNTCSYCLREFKTPRVFAARHFVQYHKTDEYGPPGRLRGFIIETDKDVDNLHGNTVWLISGEGSPKQYFLECSFVVDKVGEIGKPDQPKNYARGEKGVRPSHPLPLNDYPWFVDLKKSLGVLRGLGLSEIGRTSLSELEKLLQKDLQHPKVPSKSKKAGAKVAAANGSARRTGKQR
jgi:hypothetical protein